MTTAFQSLCAEELSTRCFQFPSLPSHLFHSEEGGGDFPTTLRSAREGQVGLSYSDDSHCCSEKRISMNFEQLWCSVSAGGRAKCGNAGREGAGVSTLEACHRPISGLQTLTVSVMSQRPGSKQRCPVPQ